MLNVHLFIKKYHHIFDNRFTFNRIYTINVKD